MSAKGNKDSSEDDSSGMIPWWVALIPGVIAIVELAIIIFLLFKIRKLKKGGGDSKRKGKGKGKEKGKSSAHGKSGKKGARKQYSSGTSGTATKKSNVSSLARSLEASLEKGTAQQGGGDGGPMPFDKYQVPEQDPGDKWDDVELRRHKLIDEHGRPTGAKRAAGESDGSGEGDHVQFGSEKSFPKSVKGPKEPKTSRKILQITQSGQSATYEHDLKKDAKRLQVERHVQHSQSQLESTSLSTCTLCKAPREEESRAGKSAKSKSKASKGRK